MGERMLVADDVAGRPPRRDIGVLAVGDGDDAEAARRSRFLIEFELVHPLEIPHETSLRPVDLEAVVVFPTGRKPRSLVVADRSVRELHQRLRRIVDVDLAAAARILWVWALADEGPQQAGHLDRFTHQA